MTGTLSADEYERLSNTLSGWGMPQEQITELLSHGVFGPGVIGMQPEGSMPGVGILVDETRDPELHTMFEHRRATHDDETFLANWRLGPVWTCTILCPHASEAIFGYDITIQQPIQLRRTFLLIVSKQAHILSWLQQPGNSVWLVPHTAGMQAWATRRRRHRGEPGGRMPTTRRDRTTQRQPRTRAKARRPRRLNIRRARPSSAATAH